MSLPLHNPRRKELKLYLLPQITADAGLLNNNYNQQISSNSSHQHQVSQIKARKELPSYTKAADQLLVLVNDIGEQIRSFEAVIEKLKSRMHRIETKLKQKQFYEMKTRTIGFNQLTKADDIIVTLKDIIRNQDFLSKNEIVCSLKLIIQKGGSSPDINSQSKREVFGSADLKISKPVMSKSSYSSEAFKAPSLNFSQLPSGQDLSEGVRDRSEASEQKAGLRERGTNHKNSTFYGLSQKTVNLPHRDNVKSLPHHEEANKRQTLRTHNTVIRRIPMEFPEPKSKLQVMQKQSQFHNTPSQIQSTVQKEDLLTDIGARGGEAESWADPLLRSTGVSPQMFTKDMSAFHQLPKNFKPPPKQLPI